MTVANHLAIAAAGFGAFIFFALGATFTSVLCRTRNESSLLKWRQQRADELGLGTIERFSQHPLSLLVNKWLSFALAAAALAFTGWHIVSAIVLAIIS